MRSFPASSISITAPFHINSPPPRLSSFTEFSYSVHKRFIRIHHDSRMIKRKTSPVPLIIASASLFGIVLLTTNKISARHRYDEPRLLGLTKEPAAQILGAPTNRLENDNVWIYQYGSAPKGALKFQRDKVAKVWSATADRLEP